MINEILQYFAKKDVKNRERQRDGEQNKDTNMNETKNSSSG